jgi:hypothetical protein
MPGEGGKLRRVDDPRDVAVGFAIVGVLLVIFGSVLIVNAHDPTPGDPPPFAFPIILLIVAIVCFAVCIGLLIHDRRR